MSPDLSPDMFSMELVKRIRASPGDGAAKEELYRRVEAMLLEGVRRKIPQNLRARIDAEDILDQAYMKALQAIDSFQPSGEKSFYAWVYKIAKNLIVDDLARRSAVFQRFAVEEGDPGPRASRIQARRRTSVRSVLARRDLIEALLKKLEKKEADVIRLHQLEGRSIEDIAVAWEKSIDSVRRFYSRSMEKLKALAGEKG